MDAGDEHTHVLDFNGFCNICNKSYRNLKAVIHHQGDSHQGAKIVCKVIEPEVQPGDLFTRREYAARWLVSASSILSRNTELAFDDITPEDPDFPSIQGLAEAGLVSRKLSRRDISSSDENQCCLCFSPER
ncbi:hypothetical protein Vadar_027422 [Vaccinium darrowii]|uniref:Uncharacterized protein n=1 Tax=Vaccinium darrowii TaxID=229202 RepID=A0ACB7YQ92_9ERIC|nr:hypothetical protein Vadar_027422 [Vaccinium darrowii]